MRFTLICLFDQGRRLSKEELAEAAHYTGNLMVEDTWRNTGTGRRNFRIAKLYSLDSSPARYELLPPLMDPDLPMTDTTMYLTGYEIVPTGGVPIHFAQQWALRAV